MDKEHYSSFMAIAIEYFPPLKLVGYIDLKGSEFEFGESFVVTSKQAQDGLAKFINDGEVACTSNNLTKTVVAEESK